MYRFVAAIALVVASGSADEAVLEGRPVREWVAERRSEDWSVRAAGEKILQAHARIALPALAREKSGRPEPEHRYADEFISALAKGRGDALPDLLPLLVCDDWKLRETTTQIIGWIGPAAEPAVPSLVHALRDPTWPVRMQAAYALQSVGVWTPEVISGLRARLGDEADIVSIAASIALGRGPDATLPALVDALGDPAPRIRRFAARALAERTQPPEAARPQLLAMLRDDSPEIQLEAIAALNRWPASKLRDAVPVLVQLLESPQLRCVAARLLARKGEQHAVAALPTLIALMQAPFGVESCADGAYGDIAAIGLVAVPALIGLLDHPASFTRRNALIALGQIEPPTPEALNAIAGALADDVIGVNAQVLLAERGADAVAVLTAGLSSVADATRVRSAYALGRIGQAASAAVPTLLTRLPVESGETQRAIAHALGTIGGDRSKEAVPELRRMLADPLARRAAAGALARISGPAAVDVVPILIEALREEVKGACPHPVADGELSAIGAAALPALVELLADDSFPSKWTVLGLLDPLGTKALEAARPALRKWVETEGSPWALAAASRLQRLGETASPRLVAVFAKAAEDENPWSRLEGAEGLVRADAGDQRAKAILLELREHPYDAIRSRADAALH